MIKPLAIEEFLTQSQGHLVLDVRSEGEYEQGHIPHALNLPLFTNEERKQVGTTYKQKSKNEAILQGLDMVGKKMGDFVRFAQPLIQDNKIFIHCWRGGMRSGSMAWLFNLFGYEVYTLQGGYKIYRHYVLGVLAAPRPYIVIGGKTGSGKTRVLQALKDKGEQVIDLEQLAHHKGSAFGMLGQPKQPTSEQFENLLALQLSAMDASRAIWLEDESMRIGTVVLQQGFWKQMRSAPLLVLEVPAAERIQQLVQDYAGHSIEGLENSLLHIQKRLGHEQWKTAVEKLHEKDFAEVARIALHYYDKTYSYGLTVKEAEDVVVLPFAAIDPEEISTALLAQKTQLKIFS
ncbi:MAG: tRNA 2-selenouridine(34) synthase MnmH [Bacteroidetes bacterium]|nr:tRNA 2-selenouridine(34) synthase MnmH [Bacteroidota bacterium]